MWLEWGVGAGSLIILTGVLVHRAARPLRGSVSCGSGWSVPCVSIQLTLSQTTGPVQPIYDIRLNIFVFLSTQRPHFWYTRADTEDTVPV